MEMTGEELIALPQQATWDALNDTAVLMNCIPGCDSMEKQSDTEYLLTMTAKVGPVSAKFKGKMTLLDVQAPDSYKLQFEGQGGVAGFAKGEAQVNLAPEAENTRLSYSVKANIGGKLAQVGARLIDGVAKKIAGQFFAAFNKRASGAGG
ncbi:MAG: carbon monoxide dehydrogenase subunit G [Betaproteobacteria bacterium]|jgi:carbon monoxide dehydrogenase subunit G|nr:carbon monoxide dehydrogenase subunit G [Betaproteobacteria bacterium]MDH4293943.1 carbon monoxide dehydrogenase subunit G [Betaproteobacteria bacterium]